MNNSRPYVGITGFTTAIELDRVLSELDSHPLPHNRQLMAGVLVSRKSLDGEVLKPNWSPIYPNPNLIESFIWPARTPSADENLLRTLHFNTREPDLFGQLIELDRIVPSLEAIQLNMVAPLPAELKRYGEDYRHDVRFILQVGPTLIADFKVDPSGLASYIEPYRGLVSHALLDVSGGVGYPLEVDLMLELLARVDWDDLGILPGVAGGVCAENVGELAPLLMARPTLSWDAQGRLMGRNGKLDLIHCRDYLSASSELLALIT